MPSVISKLREKFQVRRFIVVGDRGLFSNENLKLFTDKGHEFIVGLKLGLLKDRYDEIDTLKNFKWINEDIAIYEMKYKSYRCIVTWSKERAKQHNYR